MSIVNKLLIIDNQYNQYKRLNDSLTTEKYSVYPSDDEYRSFLASVKVFIHYPRNASDKPAPDSVLLNEEHQKEAAYRKLAWDHILSFIDKAELILMDYCLGSSLTCMTGLDLAQEIWSIKDIPVLILSRDEQTKEDTLLEWNKVISAYPNRIEWKVKGYWGTQLFPDSFVNTIIIPAIEALYTKWKSSEVSDKLKGDKRLIIRLEGMLTYNWANKRASFCLAQLKKALELDSVDLDCEAYRDIRARILAVERTNMPVDLMEAIDLFLNKIV